MNWLALYAFLAFAAWIDRAIESRVAAERAMVRALERSREPWWN